MTEHDWPSADDTGRTLCEVWDAILLAAACAALAFIAGALGRYLNLF